jgi:hypothetical protein
MCSTLLRMVGGLTRTACPNLVWFDLEGVLTACWQAFLNGHHKSEEGKQPYTTSIFWASVVKASSTPWAVLALV